MNESNGEHDRVESASAHYLAPDRGRLVDQRVFAYLAKLLAPRFSGGSLLELGLGDTVWAPILLDRFDRVESVEGSPSILEKATLELQNHPKRASWVPHLSLFEEFRADRRFDVILASYVLEHVADPVGLLSLARRSWLAPDGHVEIIVPNATSLHRQLGVEMGRSQKPTDLGEADRAAGHRRVFTVESLRDVVLQAGLEIAEESGYFVKSLPNAFMTDLDEDRLHALIRLDSTKVPIDITAILHFSCLRPTS